MRRWDQYPGIGDYAEPEYEEREDVGGIDAEWYLWNDDRTDEDR